MNNINPKIEDLFDNLKIGGSEPNPKRQKRLSPEEEAEEEAEQQRLQAAEQAI